MYLYYDKEQNQPLPSPPPSVQCGKLTALVSRLYCPVFRDSITSKALITADRISRTFSKNSHNIRFISNHIVKYQ